MRLNSLVGSYFSSKHRIEARISLRWYVSQVTFHFSESYERVGCALDWLKRRSDFSKLSVLVDRKINNMFVLLVSLGDTTSDVGPMLLASKTGHTVRSRRKGKKHALSRKGIF